MALETLDDVVDELMDKLGVFGGCPADYHGKPDEDDRSLELSRCPKDGCRCCIEAGLKQRIRSAVELEQRLAKTR